MVRKKRNSGEEKEGRGVKGTGASGIREMDGEGILSYCRPVLPP